jgi:beta-lactam-binding protein with PASTA domain
MSTFILTQENDMKGAVVKQGIEAGKRVEVWTKVPLKYSGDAVSHTASAVVKNEKDIKNQNEKKQVANTTIEKIESEKMPQFVGLRADRAIYAASQLGLKIECSGNGGKVTGQFPKAGSPISSGQSCSFVVN